MLWHKPGYDPGGPKSFSQRAGHDKEESAERPLGEKLGNKLLK
jgi:hypothetical protein